jgi:dTDP-4-amino-4,6-dideoxygalactose transaminase
LIANLYLNELKDYYLKKDLIKKPNLKFENFSFKKKKYLHAFYRLNLFLNKNKIKQIKFIEQLNKKKIDCGVGSCPEIYNEKIFKKLKLNPKKRLANAKLLGETSIVFPINPYKSIRKIKSEINCIKKILNNFL